MPQSTRTECRSALSADRYSHGGRSHRKARESLQRMRASLRRTTRLGFIHFAFQYFQALFEDLHFQ